MEKHLIRNLANVVLPLPKKEIWLMHHKINQDKEFDKEKGIPFYYLDMFNSIKRTRLIDVFMCISTR